MTGPGLGGKESPIDEQLEGEYQHDGEREVEALDHVDRE